MPEASNGRPRPSSRGVKDGTPHHGHLVGLAPLAVTAGFFLLLPPDLLFHRGVPALTDLPGHLLPPTLLGNDLLPRLQVRGWSMDWFAGFPLYYFYFPLPALFQALLGLLVGPALALRIAMVAPLVSLPWALYALTRWSSLGDAESVGVVLGGSGLLVMSSYRALGGNISSTLSGEYSYGWALVLAVLYLGLVARADERRPGGRLAGLVLAASVLSHVLPPTAACLGTTPFLLASSRRRAILESWGVAALLTAFWTVPFMARLGQSADVGWAYTPGIGDVMPLELAFLLPAAAVGIVLARRRPVLGLLATTGLAGMLAAAVPQSVIMRGRLLPMWFLAVHVLAGAGLGWAWARVRAQRWWPGLPVLAVGGGAALLMLIARGPGPWRTGSTDVLRGLDEVPGREELAELLERLRQLPPGRVHWEAGSALSRWGGAPALSLIPYWTGHPTLWGLWGESSALHPFVRWLDAELTRAERHGPYPTEPVTAPWDPEAALARLRMLGVRYLITHSDETGRAVESLVSRSSDRFGELRLFDLGEAPLVSTVPCVEGMPDGRSFRERAERWFERWTRGAPTLVVGGHDQLGTAVSCSTMGTDAARILAMDDEHIRFRTDRPGVPHLVRVSYFPNWQPEGAKGPYLASPWFMVVVPDGEIVDLQFRPTVAEWMGWILTGTGVVGIALATIRKPRVVAEKRQPVGRPQRFRNSTP